MRGDCVGDNEGYNLREREGTAMGLRQLEESYDRQFDGPRDRLGVMPDLGAITRTYTFTEKDVKTLISQYLRLKEGVTVDVAKISCHINPGCSNQRDYEAPSAIFSVEVKK